MCSVPNNIPKGNNGAGPIGAICGPPDSQDALSNSRNNESVPQPRQPTNLQGLLRFAMDATNENQECAKSHYVPMDQERKKFLENALNSMTVNVVELLEKQIKEMADLDDVGEMEDVSKYMRALNIIIDYVDNIDIANDFHKIGGFQILEPLLRCKQPSMRANGCRLIAELCQNNPYWQNILIEKGFIPNLLDMLRSDTYSTASENSISALGAIVRGNARGLSEFIEYGGPHILIEALTRDGDCIKCRAAFLLNSLCSSDPDLKSRLVFLGIIPILIALMKGDRLRYHRHVIELLLTLFEDNNAAAVNLGRNPAMNLKETLQNYISKHENESECEDEVENCKRVLHVVFSSNY